MSARREVIAKAVTFMAAAVSHFSFAQEKAASMPLSNPRYAKNPVALFFEKYILDVIGHLPPGQSEKIQSMNLHLVFKTNAREWRAVIRETLHLSNTIDVAILDLWCINQDMAAKRGVEYSPQAFAQDFTDQYQKDGSQVDVWPPGALEAAKARIAACKPATTPR